MLKTKILMGLLALGTTLGSALHAQYVEQRVFFYNQDSGAGASDVFANDRLTHLQLGVLRKNWTSVVAWGSQLLFYDKLSGIGVLTDQHRDGTLADNEVMQLGKGWTHIVPHDREFGGFALFYNQDSGAARIGRLGDNAPIRQFAPGWTKILDTKVGLLFYNADKGSAAIGDWQYEARPGCGIDTFCDVVGAHYVERRGYPPGSLAKQWDQIVETDLGFVFYHASNGLLVVVDIDPDGNIRDYSNTVTNVGPNFSSIVWFAGHLLFYNKSLPYSVLGHLVGPAEGSPQAVHTYVADASLPGAFEKGWTHVVPYVYAEYPPVIIK